MNSSTGRILGSIILRSINWGFFSGDGQNGQHIILLAIHMNGCYRIWCLLNDYSSKKCLVLEASILGEYYFEPYAQKNTDELNFNKKQCYPLSFQLTLRRYHFRCRCFFDPAGIFFNISNQKTPRASASWQAYADTEVCHYTLLSQPDRGETRCGWIVDLPNCERSI